MYYHTYTSLRKKTEKNNTAKEVVTDTLTVAGGTTVVSYLALVPGKFALGVSIPYLMSFEQQ